MSGAIPLAPPVPVLGMDGDNFPTTAVGAAWSLLGLPHNGQTALYLLI